MREPRKDITGTAPGEYGGKVPRGERRKRAIEIGIMLLCALAFVMLSRASQNIARLQGGIPASSTILMFALFNVNILLLLTFVFLALRNIVKLIYDRRRKVLGARLRTRLVLAFVGLSIVPTVVLFFFSIQFINTSITFWWSVPVEKSLEKSLHVGQHVYETLLAGHRNVLGRAQHLFENKGAGDSAAIQGLAEEARSLHGLDVFEVYGPDGTRICAAVEQGRQAPPALPPEEVAREGVDPGGRLTTQPRPEGQWVVTICRIPRTSGPARLFLGAGTLFAPDFAANMEFVARGFEQYRQRAVLLKPIQTGFYLTLSIVAALIVFSSVWVGFYLAKSLTVPIRDLAEGTRRVAGGDLSFFIARGSDDEMGELVDAFNSMCRDLRAGRVELERHSARLAEQNAEIESRRRYMEIVLQNVSTGIISFDARGVITTLNKSAEKMLEVGAASVTGKSFRTLPRGGHLDKFKEIMQTTVGGGRDTVDMSLGLVIGGRPRSFMVHFSALRDEQGRYVGMLVAFDDMTELERAQRMAAWREVARRVAHEVKNPLTPIKLSAQRLSRKFGDTIGDPVFSECTRAIVDQVDLIRDLVNEFSSFARFPAPRPVPSDLPALVREAMAPYQEGNPSIVFETRVARLPGLLLLDPRQIKRALMNLFDNAIAAIGEEPGTVSVFMDLEPAGQKVRLEITDTGEGLTGVDPGKFFEPYYSTKKTGTGLGLSIVNSIISDHNGTIRMEQNHPRGARFIIELPAQGGQTKE
jgi:two-component system nitrogen regulation sensor histidine kinase NtrY